MTRPAQGWTGGGSWARAGRGRAVACAAWTGLGAALLAAPAALAQEAALPEVVLDNDVIYRASLSALTVLLVLAVLLESALTVIFNWRVFQAYFSGRGVRTIVMVAVAGLLVWGLDVDVVASLIGAYKTSETDAVAATVPSDWVTRSVTALILAGGSAGVHNVMKALGYRIEREEEVPDPQPTQGMAWLAVRAIQRRSVGPAYVRIRDLGLAPAGVQAPIAGMIPFQRQRLAELLFRAPSRFPQNGGHALVPGHLYEVTVEGRDRAGNVVTGIKDYPLVLADRAIVDLEVVL